jgi:transcriptional antiterminator NusG
MLFEVGESVKVIDGAFTDFKGTVEDVNPAMGKLRVIISLYGRPAPLDLKFAQVERA